MIRWMTDLKTTQRWYSSEWMKMITTSHEQASEHRHWITPAMILHRQFQYHLCKSFIPLRPSSSSLIFHPQSVIQLSAQLSYCSDPPSYFPLTSTAPLAIYSDSTLPRHKHSRSTFLIEFSIIPLTLAIIPVTMAPSSPPSSRCASPLWDE
jgi:hypothetical protein